MTPPNPADGLRPAKRAAILAAARTVFATEGFTRATIDAIAAEAGVSTRTIYKHFRDKDELFATVLVASATTVGDDYEAAVREGLEAATTPHERLMALAQAATRRSRRHPEHFAMMRQVEIEAPRLPAGVLTAWRKAGPGRLERETIAQLRVLDEEGALAIDDFRRAAHHLLALARSELTPGLGRRPLSGKAAEGAIAAGVEAFARAYAPR